MRYEKPFKSFEEQADLLIARGMQADRAVLIQCLQDVGYYRLSGYWHIFKQEDGDFLAGTTFERVWDIYVFDRQFKLVVFDAIEHVEIYLRTQLAYNLSQAGGPFGYAEAANLPNLDPEAYDKLMDRCRAALRRSREPFALHFRQAYGDAHELPPYWMLVNLLDFGMALTLYRGAPDSIRKQISRTFHIEPRVMDSWLVTLNTTRNICAHHGRLWNRTLGTRPTIPRAKNDPRWHEPFEVRPDKTFAVLTILSHLLEVAAPGTVWRTRLFGLLGTRSAQDLRCMGFEDGWQECPLWSKWLLCSKDGRMNAKE